MVSNYKNFNGVRYSLFEDRKFKSTADEIAKKLRKKGVKSRAIPMNEYINGNKLYAIYINE